MTSVWFVIRVFVIRLALFPFSFTFLYLINFVVNVLLAYLEIDGSRWLVSISSMSSSCDTMNPVYRLSDYFEFRVT